ncbi:hypothetical protein H4S07_001384 [Coemansia furcata]|uniref:Uncharacterized protein n=1 Tax=Coemansia furcata TaxID=417177 RepID=A0ACC1LNU1_9FUNG|nr:hypothetical protein H4S07_001384 [Coemansia furcata]
MANLRLSDSPTRVSGTQVSLGSQFAASCGSDRICVDKTLICKGFWDVVDDTSRICLPRRSGKTFNLQLLQLFFSPLPELDCLGILPDDDDSNSAIALSRAKRESFFNESLLKKLHPEFFDEHFMKHPVVFISFESCKRRSSGGLVKRLCKAIARSVQHHLDELKHSKLTVCPEAIDAEMDLRGFLETVKQLRGLPNDDFAQRSELPCDLFSALSRFVRRQFGGYILLVDEYDIPFLTLLEGNWDEVDRDDSSTILETLFQDMFKVCTHQNLYTTGEGLSW